MPLRTCIVVVVIVDPVGSLHNSLNPFFAGRHVMSLLNYLEREMGKEMVGKILK